jgi:predicted metalloprotease
MRWQGERESENVEDRRGMGGGTMVAGGGIGTIVVVLLISAIFGVNPLQLLQQLPQGAPGGNQVVQPGQVPPGQEQLVKFVKVVLAETEDVWTRQFQLIGHQYRVPKLVLFTGHENSACGFASAAVGPFYCPVDEKVYLDLSFFDEMQRRFHSPGDFAQAYVIAHEVGHHVQKLLGKSDQVDALRRRSSEKESNALSVRLELQADFYAGVWAHYMQRDKRILDPGDIEEAMNAAKAIGDDALQRQSQGYVRPETFTHGSSEQRVRWFTKGYQSGDIKQGDTFNAEDL